MDKPMYPNSSFLRSLLVLAALAASHAQAQDLHLFEPTEVEPGGADAPVPEFLPVANEQQPYTLRSVTRFGNQYNAVLVDRSGEAIKVAWQDGELAPVPNSAFSITGGQDAVVVVAYPSGSTCVEAPAAGLTCVAGDRAQLRLAVVAPLEINGSQAAVNLTQPGGQAVLGAAPMGPQLSSEPAQAQNGQQVFINPFSGEPEVMPEVQPEELAARQQRQELRAARLRQFEQQQRIEDADIPPGMQRVRTPFGDRLLPIRE
jgi:hypothetical protein